MEILLTIIIILVSTKVFGHLAVMIGQPAVLGKLVIGIVLGPALLSWVNHSEVFQVFADIGVLLLMFLAGLETDTKQLKENWKPSVAVAVIGIIIPFLSAFGVGSMFGFDLNHSVFLGVLFSATSVSITVQVLKEMNVMQTRESTTILGAAVVDDILVVILLAFVMSFMGGDGAADVSIPMVILKKVIFFAVAIGAGIYLVPMLLKLASRFKVTVPVTSAALVICFAFAYFGEMLGMAGIIGTFIAGLFISQTNFKDEIEHSVEPIANALFVPFFYVSVGLSISFAGVFGQLWFLVVCTVVAVLSKLIGGFAGARLTGFDKLSSLSIGSGMVSRGEVALIIGTTGLSSGLLHQDYYTTVIISVILTTLIAPPMLKKFFLQIKENH
ncbi:sodium:proton antiporter [Vagococcus penaei]|uniref:Sodium:proton antiporter n=1 Tax=Vagococcus penaei TaxID=633807 RepID=A0A1Q2D757_9ENTE|nr:cation:proton antiporter [Vagococcus penaei]AQP54172.1 sodium:proton antiporter [Vagococcus penaei]RSU02171.1 sodium:proton antiporter [Vagococcus penaei]